jgi:hypothetical protein
MPHAGPSRLPSAATGLPRRVALSLLAAAMAPARATAAGETFGDKPGMLVAGPAGGQLDRWAQLLAATIQPHLPEGTVLALNTAGGDDGVTGANQFAARVPPDGNTLLLAPGDAAMAWLVGDPRAKFDVARWVGVAAGMAPALVMARGPSALRRGARLRVAMAGPAGPDLAALLGLELAGFVPEPVFDATPHPTGRPGLAAEAVDVVLLRGVLTAERLLPLAAQGFAPLFTLGGATPGNRDAEAPDFIAATPGLLQLAGMAGAGPGGALFAAWRGVAAAAQTGFALVLPHLAPPALVALWRQAGAQAAAAAPLHDAAPNLRLVSVPVAHALTHALGPEPPALVALRAWMAARLDWAPG